MLSQKYQNCLALQIPPYESAYLNMDKTASIVGKTRSEAFASWSGDAFESSVSCSLHLPILTSIG